LNYIDLFSDDTTLTTGAYCMTDAFSGVASEATPKLTLRIHGTTVLPVTTLAAGLLDSNVLVIQVAPELVSAYQSSPNWSNINDNKFVALP